MAQFQKKKTSISKNIQNTQTNTTLKNTKKHGTHQLIKILKKHQHHSDTKMTHISIPKSVTTIIAICLICTCIAPALAENTQNTELIHNYTFETIKQILSQKINDVLTENTIDRCYFDEPVFIPISYDNKISKFTTATPIPDKIKLPTTEKWHLIWNPDETFGINAIILLSEPVFSIWWPYTTSQKGTITVYVPINQNNSIFIDQPTLELQSNEFIQIDNIKNNIQTDNINIYTYPRDPTIIEIPPTIGMIKPVYVTVGHTHYPKNNPLKYTFTKPPRIIYYSENITKIK